MQWTRGWTVIAGLTIASFMVLSACSGTDSDEIVNLTTAPIAAETTVATTTPTTTAPTTTSSTANAPSTTAVQTTTSTTAVDNSPAEDIEAEIAQAVVEARDAFLAYAYDPNDDNRQRLESSRSIDAFAEARELVDDLYKASQSVKAASPSVESIDILSINVVGSDQALVLVCQVSDAVVLDNSTGEVVDDLVVSRLKSNSMQRTDQRWVLAAAETFQRYDGVSSCDG